MRSKTLYQCLAKDVYGIVDIDRNRNVISFSYGYLGSSSFIVGDLLILSSIYCYLMETYNITPTECNTVWCEFKKSFLKYDR